MPLEEQTKGKPALTPFIMTAGIIILDQITKFLIVLNIKPGRLGPHFFNDFIWIVHAQNLGMAFSMGDGFPVLVRRILFIVLPMIVMIFVVIYYFRGKDLTKGMRWVMAGILGGGVGNLIDRIARPGGVVDFFSVRFYGIFGMERFPAFNVADSSITVSGILLVVLFIVQEIRSREQKG